MQSPNPDLKMDSDISRNTHKVLSRELFRDGPVLRIVHGDQVYVLRRTSTDKLILTK